MPKETAIRVSVAFTDQSNHWKNCDLVAENAQSVVNNPIIKDVKCNLQLRRAQESSGGDIQIIRRKKTFITRHDKRWRKTQKG